MQRSFITTLSISATITCTLFATGASAAVLEILPVEGLRQAPDFLALDERTDLTTLTYDNGAGEPVGTENVFGGQGAFSGVRESAFDLGPDWADMRIVETWSLTRSSAPVADDTPTGFQALWWDDDPDGAFDAGEGDVAENTLNFFLNTTNGEDETWFLDVQLTEANAVVPQGRFLVVQTDAAVFANSNVFSEVAFVGYTVPEPTSALAILGLGGMLLARRR